MVKKSPRRLLYVLILLIIIAALVTGWWVYSVYRFSRPWRRIAREDTEADVLTTLGKPHYVFKGQGLMQRTYEEENGELTTAGRTEVKEFRYDSFLFGPYVVGVDSDGRVVAKGHNTLCCSQ
jgi:hypothetical protein